jgi:hypothetical protein
MNVDALLSWLKQLQNLPILTQRLLGLPRLRNNCFVS